VLLTQVAAWFKKGSGTVVRSTLRAVPVTVPGPFLNHRMLDSVQRTGNNSSVPFDAGGPTDPVVAGFARIQMDFR